MIKVNENPPSAYPTVETGNIALKADLPGTIECGCRIARNGTMTQEIRFCPLHAAAPKLFKTLKGIREAAQPIIRDPENVNTFASWVAQETDVALALVEATK
jgi:hypothetical protein